jgi:hypothetical protein
MQIPPHGYRVKGAQADQVFKLGLYMGLRCWKSTGDSHDEKKCYDGENMTSKKDASRSKIFIPLHGNFGN